MIRWRRILQDDDGPTAVEYAVMLALVIMFCLGAVRALGTVTSGSFQNAANAFDSDSSGSSPSTGGPSTGGPLPVP